MDKNTRGFHDYVEQIEQESSSHPVITVNLSEIPNDNKDEILFLDLFFLDTPNAETGRTWGITLGTEHNYDNYLPICELSPIDDRSRKSTNIKNIPLLHASFIPSMSKTNFIMFYKN